MKSAVLLAVAGLVLFSGSCSSASEPGEITVPADAQAVIDGAVLALADAESYRTTFAFPLPAEDVREAAMWEVHYQKPDSYRMLLFGEDGPTTEVCESYTQPGGSGRFCQDVVTEVTERTVAESVLVGDGAFGRRCDGVDQGCEAWRESPRTGPPEFGLSPTFTAGWPAVVLEMIAVDAGTQLVDGNQLVRVSGSVNLLRAIFENQRRLSEAAGITSFGTSCTVTFSPTPGGGPGEEVCHEITFEELLEGEDDVAFEDENPSEVVIWFSAGDLLPRRMEITQAPRPDDPSAGALVIEFGDYNEVTIEAPE